MLSTIEKRYRKFFNPKKGWKNKGLFRRARTRCQVAGRRGFLPAGSTLLLLALLPALVAAEEPLVFWTTEVEQDRLKTQEGLAAAFRKRTGISIKVVPVQENMLPERITAAFAARSLPDVVYHPIDFTHGWVDAGILDSRAATKCIRDIGRENFGEGPLRLVEKQGLYGAVPIDGWVQLLLYRKDLFREKGLPPPDSWEAIREAAEALHDPPLLWGFEAATDPGQAYTQQVFEHLALSNGVRLCDSRGEIHLNTEGMKQTLEFYRTLAGYSPPGNLSWLHTRMDYLSGRAAMILWSPFILDELSGLRQDQPVVPDLERGVPGFLARNTGFVASLRGPHGRARYGQVSSLGITVDADRARASEWIRFLLSEGYAGWMAMAPEGKLPIRKGTPEDPDYFIRVWMDLEFGTTKRARISEFYGPDVAERIIKGVERLDRWGFPAGRGNLVSKVYATKVVPKVLKRYLDRGMSEEEAAEEMERRIRALE